MNRITVQGRLGATPELRFTQSGIAVAEISIADSFKKMVNGIETWSTNWWRATLWREKAEWAKANLTKGQTVKVEGKVETREYTDRSGNKKTVYDLIAFEISPVTQKPDAQVQDRYFQLQTNEVAPFQSTMTEDDIPF